MSGRVTLALDSMGGDHGAGVVVPAALSILKKRDDIDLILVGDEQLLAEHLSDVEPAIGDRIRVHHASQVVGMDELPSQALRGKKDSSMRVAINLVKQGEAQACVSAGNTGALMATARFVLKTLPGIDRPAIICPIPAKGGHTHMLDLGANADCTAEHLVQFAVMGSALANAVHDMDSPRVGLLNIGEEEIKGTETVRDASQLLGESSLNYIGYVEGNDIFSGDVDVVVSDGFVGNVSLKTMEGVAKMIGAYIREEFSRNLFTKLLGLIAMPVLKALRRRTDPRRYNGASLVGLQGIVIKSHGGADVVAYENAIRIAALEVEKDVPARISRLLANEEKERQGV
ncbi:glycerol-3-phosphate acyltransferase PlsX [Natronospira proteinivora]|uniref:Phosphate acyltransferase n=1 Tax=Natronospira proteinivora TaxID=1807133 RepID=A0ABT1G6J6_9GAMM|nr:phosphate acyltransferase PlsX [Natronospira proteinivora]MCP1726717.1 glycerol-3-phosphate acyltransferase PlsX [Natronospira proteinivora]